MLGVVFHYTHTPQAAGPRGLPPQLTSHRGACSGFLGWKGRRWAEGMSFRTGMNSPSGIFHPLFTGCPRLSLSPSSLSSHQGHPRPAHGGPCAPLSHPMAHIFPRSCIPVPSPRCIPDVCPVCLPPPFLYIFFLLPMPGAVGGLRPTRHHDHDLSVPSLQGSSPFCAAVPLLAPSSASPNLPLFFPFSGRVQIPWYLHCPCFYSQPIRGCTRSACLLPPTALLLPPQSPREYFCFLILLHFSLVFLPGKAIT